MTRIEDQHPDLFTDLTAQQKRALNSAISNAVLEGWDPTREDVELQVKYARGELTSEQILAEQIALAEHRTGGPDRG